MNQRPSPEPAQEEALFHVLRTLDANPRTSQHGLAFQRRAPQHHMARTAPAH